VDLLESERWMLRIRAPKLIGGVRLFPDDSRRRLEKVPKLPRRLRLHALERLSLTGGVLSQRLFREFGELILGLRKGL